MTMAPRTSVYEVSRAGSERATTGGGGKLATRAGKTHVVWQDRTEAGYPNRVATFEHESGALTEPLTLNHGEDNHARPNLVMDHEGVLHAVISGHNSPVVHRRSERPNDASAWSEPVTIGHGTYPVPVCAPDGTLHVAMRNAERWNGVDLYRKPPGGAWEGPRKLVYRDPALPGYAAFHAGLAVAADGTLHAAIDFYESEGIWERRGLHQAVAYMRSPDGGATWTRADGARIELPARPESMDVLARDTADERHEPISPPVVLAQGNLVLDDAATPHILYADHRDAPGQVIHAYPDGAGRWQREPIEALPDAFPGHRPTQVRAALTRTADGTFAALLNLRPLGEGWDGTLPTRALSMAEGTDDRLAWLVSSDNGNTWCPHPALEGQSATQPNVERPMGGNEIPGGRPPPFLFFEGATRYPEEGEMIQNRVQLAVP